MYSFHLGAEAEKLDDLPAKSRLGFVGVDVDSLHHYYPAQVLGPERFCLETGNVVYERAIPRFLELFDRLNIRGTFFIVAKDSETSLVQHRLREIVAGGHEIASHSYTHLQTFLRLPPDAKAREIAKAEDVLQQASGIRVCGFRAPAWGIDEQALDILERRGYIYDSSIMPTSWLPFLKASYFIKSRGRIGPGDLLGRCRYRHAPLEPYFPDPDHIERKGRRKILELPIAVVPFGRAPFWATVHLTANKWNLFLFCYQSVSRQLRSLHYQCHAIDLLDLEKDHVPPVFQRMFGLRHSLSTRRDLLGRILAHIHANYQLLPARELSKLIGSTAQVSRD